jgi:hypothetical protein
LSVRSDQPDGTEAVVPMENEHRENTLLHRAARVFLMRQAYLTL